MNTEYFQKKGGGGKGGGGRGGKGSGRKGSGVTPGFQPKVILPEYSKFPRRPWGHGFRRKFGIPYGAHYDLNYNPWGPNFYSSPYWAAPVSSPIFIVDDNLRNVMSQQEPCGGQSCNMYYNTTKKQFENLPGSECKCCAEGKICRMNTNANEPGIIYNDCCAGLECQAINSGDRTGFCRKK